MYVGNKQVEAVYLGDREITSAYLGSLGSKLNYFLKMAFDKKTPVSAFSNELAWHPWQPFNKTAQYVVVNNTTYITYMGDQDDPFVILYNHTTKTWSSAVKVGTNPFDNLDNHGSPSMIIDKDGYIHVMYGAHDTAIYYSRSTNPYDITTWSTMSYPAFGAYPQLIELSDGKLYMFFRRLSVPDHTWSYKVSSDNGTTWGDYNDISNGFAYAIYKKGVGDLVHCAMYGNDTTSINRKNIYYMKFDGTSWTSIEGTSITNPIDHATNAADVLAYNSGNYYCPSVSISYDESNNPFIIFPKGEAENAETTYQINLLRYDSGWQETTIGLGGKVREESFLNQIDVVGSNVYAYIVNQDIDIYYNIERWKSTDNGATFLFEKTIYTGFAHYPKLVDNYLNEAKLLFTDNINDDTVFNANAFLWGDSGLIANSVESTSVYATPVLGAPINAVVRKELDVFDGYINSSFGFNFNTDYVILNKDNKLLSFSDGDSDLPFTIEFYLKATDPSTQQHIISKKSSFGTAWRVQLNTNQIIVLLFSNSASTNLLSIKAPYASTEWVHVKITYDGSGVKEGVKIILDGIEKQDTIAMTGTFTRLPHEDDYTIIGKSISDTYYYRGRLDELIFRYGIK